MVRGRGSVPRPGPPKTQPLQFEEFASLIAWWDRREENERAWLGEIDACPRNRFARSLI